MAFCEADACSCLVEPREFIQVGIPAKLVGAGLDRAAHGVRDEHRRAGLHAEAAGEVQVLHHQLQPQLGRLAARGEDRHDAFEGLAPARTLVDHPLHVAELQADLDAERNGFVGDQAVASAQRVLDQLCHVAASAGAEVHDRRAGVLQDGPHPRKSLLRPPQKVTIFPSAAPFGPPETGASIIATPSASSSAASARVAAGSPVVWSTTILPLPALRQPVLSEQRLPRPRRWARRS